MCVCVCVRACGRACVRVRVCVWRIRYFCFTAGSIICGTDENAGITPLSSRSFSVKRMIRGWKNRGALRGTSFPKLGPLLIPGPTPVLPARSLQ